MPGRQVLACQLADHLLDGEGLFISLRPDGSLKLAVHKASEIRCCCSGAAVGVVAMLPIWLRRNDAKTTAGVASIKKDT